MKLYLPDAPPMPPMMAGPLPPLNTLPGFCSICRVQLIPSSYSFKCDNKSDKHPNGPYTICGRCGRRSRAKSKIRNASSYQHAQYPQYPNYNHMYGPPPSVNYGPPPPIPPNPYQQHPQQAPHPQHPQQAQEQQPKQAKQPYDDAKERFNRFLNTKNKTRHYEQVHQLINQSSEKAIDLLFKQISKMNYKQKRYLLHTVYDSFDVNNINKYDFINVQNESQNGDIDEHFDENDLESMPIGPSRLQKNNNDDNNNNGVVNKASIMKNIKQNIIKDNGYDHNLIAGNINVNYQNDEEFILANAHLLEQQENAMKQIQLEQQQMAYLQATGQQQKGNDIVDNTSLQGNVSHDDLDSDDQVILSMEKNTNNVNDNGNDNDKNQLLSLSVPNQNEINDEKDKKVQDVDDVKSLDNTDINIEENGDDKDLSLSSASNQITENKTNETLTKNNDKNNDDQNNDDQNNDDQNNDGQEEAMTNKEKEMNRESIDDEEIQSNKEEETNEEVETTETINKEKKSDFSIAITKAMEDDNKHIEIGNTNDNVDVDTDEDLDLSGIEFNTRGQSGNPTPEKLKSPLDLVNDIAESSANEEEPDEKLDQLDDDGPVINNGQIINNGMTKYQYQQQYQQYEYEYQFPYQNGYGDEKNVNEENDEDESEHLREIADLEELFGCTIGENLTEELGQDLWWYRVFAYLPRSQLENIFLTCRYFYYMKVYHEVVNDHIIRISSLPALVWKLAILKDFKIEEKFKKSMNYIIIRFIKRMDWTAKLSPTYLNGLELIKLPDTKQLYIEYFNVNSTGLDQGFLKMTNMMFQGLFGNMKSTEYVELINKTTPKQDFTWKIDAFNHTICSLNNINRIKIPCWNQELFNPTIYSINTDSMNRNSIRNIQYIYLTEMKFDNFASLLPNDNAGINAVNYFEKLQQLKGIILQFGQDTNKKTEEMASITHTIQSLLEMLKDSLQYLVIGVNRWESIIECPFVEYNFDHDIQQQQNEMYVDDEVDKLPMSYKLYQFNYRFKQELKNIFWQNYSNPNQQYKDNKKTKLIKKRQEKQKLMDETMKSYLKSSISFQIQQQFPDALQAYNNNYNQQQIHIGNDNQDEDNDSAFTYDNDGGSDVVNASSSNIVDPQNTQTEHIETAVHPNTLPLTPQQQPPQVDKEEQYIHNEEEEEEEDDIKVENSLEDLGNELMEFEQDSKYEIRRNRAAFIFIYNTQIYVEEDLVYSGSTFDRIPITVNDNGEWQCPHCTMFNRINSRKCEMCGKKKTKYIPRDVILAQQQHEQQKNYYNMINNNNNNLNYPFISNGWRCPICDGQNEDSLKNCKLCTFERPKG